ncbi:glycosyltransferase family 4 protein [Streptosporangium amethystogenes]|uniref:glycosyltransferase family 4 protein n=1 Tax=Streptosporangium amethystogenes TaxID=2002 RepID=UPI0009FE6214|nr:glycosyltransferase family 4 protein [Streptosporangium amethystogenes]
MVSSRAVPGWSNGMRILMVAPPWYDVPPHGYGGIESMVAGLVTGLTRRGHDVTMIGAGTAGTPARFLTTYGRAPSERIGEALPEVLHAARAYAMSSKLVVDVIHDHSLAGPLTAPAQAAPTVITCHGEVGGEYGEYYRVLGAGMSMVAISEAQRRIAPDLNWAGVVHNAVDVEAFPFREHKEDWTLWLGRFSEDKGAHLAIDAARAAGRRILLAGKLTEKTEHDYFDAYVRPRLGPDAEYVGEADTARKRELLAAARCLVFPVVWEEPFGMVMIEAMACGTPVVALGRGAVPEVVLDGVTGFIRGTPEELSAAIEAAGALAPHACRSRAERFFGVETMARAYEAIYRRVIAGPSRRAGERVAASATESAAGSRDLAMPVN